MYEQHLREMQQLSDECLRQKTDPVYRSFVQEPWSKQQERVFYETKEEWLQKVKRNTENGFLLNNLGVGPGSNHNTAYKIQQIALAHRDQVQRHLETRRKIITGQIKQELHNFQQERNAARDKQ